MPKIVSRLLKIVSRFSTPFSRPADTVHKSSHDLQLSSIHKFEAVVFRVQKRTFFFVDKIEITNEDITMLSLLEVLPG